MEKDCLNNPKLITDQISTVKTVIKEVTKEEDEVLSVELKSDLK